MNRVQSVFLGLMFSVFTTSASADSLSFTGTFTHDDQVQLLSFTLLSAGTVSINTLGYAGGTNLSNAVIPEGGFDPVLTLFDGAGNFLAFNDDAGVNVPADSVTGNHSDSYLQEFLAAGSYQVALTESTNYANGPTLADGFTFDGAGDFTAALCGPGDSAPFCDPSPSQRNGGWAVDISTADNTSVPEPMSLSLLVGGLGSLSLIRRRFQKN